MTKLTIEDLARIRDNTRRQTSLRQGAGRVRITVHMGTCGIAAGAREIMTALLKEVETRSLHDVIVTNSGCAGLCSQEPMITVEAAGDPAPVKYVSLNPEKVTRIVESHVLKGAPVREYALAVGSEKTR
ncbi:MAG: (2Fe-2S) ferredoxin domain-containing protein [Bacteroidota bacterium]